MRRILAATVLAAAGIAGVSAQQVPPTNVCAEDPHFGDFDFWLGNWRVTDKAGNHLGDNRIAKVEAGCMMTENWTNVAGTTGFSMNYYNPNTKKWRQIWVSAPGVEIDYTGGLDEEGSMVLTGHIHYYGQGNKARFRGTWTPNEDGTVRQLFEQYDGEKETWNVWFDGLYTRTKD